ncbi:MAG: PilX N-terminal domain-containing pilus assembly protein [Pseudomonadota bacterium]
MSTKTPARPARPASLARQRGITLVIALMMLVLLTLLALTSFNLGKSNLQIVNNMQQRDAAMAAADGVLEELISSPRFFTTPTDALATPCNGPNTRCVDINGDGVPDVTVTLTPAPTCVKAQNVKNTTLDLSNKEDAGCAVGGGQSFGVAGSVTGDSLCSDSVWDVHAVATDAVTEARVEVTKGIAVRVAKDDVTTSCP